MRKRRIDSVKSTNAHNIEIKEKLINPFDNWVIRQFNINWLSYTIRRFVIAEFDRGHIYRWYIEYFVLLINSILVCNVWSVLLRIDHRSRLMQKIENNHSEWLIRSRDYCKMPFSSIGNIWRHNNCQGAIIIRIINFWIISLFIIIITMSLIKMIRIISGLITWPMILQSFITLTISNYYRGICINFRSFITATMIRVFMLNIDTLTIVIRHCPVCALTKKCRDLSLKTILTSVNTQIQKRSWYFSNNSVMCPDTLCISNLCDGSHKLRNFFRVISPRNRDLYSLRSLAHAHKRDRHDVARCRTLRTKSHPITLKSLISLYPFITAARSYPLSPSPARKW